MVNMKKRGITGNMLRFNKDGTRHVLRDVYIQSRQKVVRGEECAAIGLERVVNYTGVGSSGEGKGNSWHDSMLMGILGDEVNGSERRGFIDVIEKGGGDGMVVVIASVLVFRDCYSMNMFVMRDFGMYWDTELRYEVMN